MNSNKRKLNGNDSASAAKHAKNNTNYYQPLQVLIDDDETADNNMDAATPKATKIIIPPITIVKHDIEKIKTICKELLITKYSIQRISIGHKLFCVLQYDYDRVIKYLKDKEGEFFTYTPKSNRPYKVVLSGLDKMDAIKLKSNLIAKGLNCLDIKPVFRKDKYNNEIILYIVYFKKGSISLKELRENHTSIDYIKVKWSYHAKQSNKVTQCYNCQMFGHGSSNCNIKPFCSQCAGHHKTIDCTITTIKCANCGEAHKSTDISCRSRNAYVNLRQRNGHNKKSTGYNTQPSHSQQTAKFDPNGAYTSFANVVSFNNTNNNLFNIDQLKELTFELINNLRNCKSKAEQFEVITSLAFKFLS